MTKSRRLPLLVAALVATLALGACGGDDDDDAADTPTDTPADTPTDEAAPAEADITIQTFQFKPSPAEAAAGTITVTNLDNTTHTFTSGTPDAPDGTFSLTLEGPDATDTVDLEPGTYDFFCQIHTSMTGSITVT